MNYLEIMFQFIYCLHCFLIVVHSKHHKNHRNHNKNNNNFNENNNNFDQNVWFNQMSDENTDHRNYHRISEYDLWNSYQSYTPSVDEGMPSIEVSSERPPYYLSYDSGIKTKYQAMEEKLIEQQMALNSNGNKQVHGTIDTRTTNMRYDVPQEISQKSRIESQIKEQTQESHENHNHNNERQTNNRRKVGKNGKNGIFGFMDGQHFFRCDKPARLEKDPDPTGHFLIPEKLDYYKQCQYFEVDPRRQFQRKVGALGLNGFFGYFENGIWVECPPPKRLEEDIQEPDVYYIPKDIAYEPKCLYYDYNVSKRFDASIDYLNSSITAEDNCSIALLPFYLLILFLNYF